MNPSGIVTLGRLAPVSLAPSSEATQQHPIGAQLNELDVAIAELDQEIGLLANQLMPSLTAASPVNSTTAAPPPGPVPLPASALTQTLGSHSFRVRMLFETVRDIRRRCEL